MSLLVEGNKCFVLALRPTGFAEETAFNIHHHLPSTKVLRLGIRHSYKHVRLVMDNKVTLLVEGYPKFRDTDVSHLRVEIFIQGIFERNSNSFFFKGHFGTLPGDFWHGLPDNQWNLSIPINGI